MSAYLELAERCEAGPLDILELSRLNGDVLRGLGWTSDDRDIYDPFGRKRLGVPDVVGSVDGALSLAAPGSHLAFDVHFMDEEGVIRYRGYSFRPDWAKWNPHDMEWLNRDGSANPLCDTPALAVTAAALRARHAQEATNVR